MPRCSPLLVVFLLLGVAAGGCSLAKSIAIGFVYDEVTLPEQNVRLGLAYAEDDEPKHRLNLFLPLADSVRARPWPTVVFVHGGGWDTGDRDFTFGGEDLYNNVGRFFARHGIGAATVSYRLMPGATWREQVEDVARAVAWVHRHVGAYGGDPDGLFVMGHSAGAYLATSVALDPEPLAREGLSTNLLCGAIPVSGAGLDLTDRQTYALEDNFDYYSARFSPDRVPLAQAPAAPFPWQVEASPIRFLRQPTGSRRKSGDSARAAPPFLILYAGGETEALQRQSRLLDEALRAAGAESAVVVVPGQSHERIVPTLSRGDRTAGPAMLAFVRARSCG